MKFVFLGFLAWTGGAVCLNISLAVVERTESPASSDIWLPFGVY
jgi:hypothetical protein